MVFVKEAEEELLLKEHAENIVSDRMLIQILQDLQ